MCAGPQDILLQHTRMVPVQIQVTSVRVTGRKGACYHWVLPRHLEAGAAKHWQRTYCTVRYGTVRTPSAIDRKDYRIRALACTDPASTELHPVINQGW